MGKRAYAVIGAHYGDEGKGQVTAWLCRRLKEEHPGARLLNVLTNGGCQRGHTVHIAGGKDFRHVFKHFGSGTPYGADTYFGPEFILNPMQFVKEDEELQKLSFWPRVMCGWHNRVQLPVDMAINQFLESRRAKSGAEHGSVGFGINETIMRYERGAGVSLFDVYDGYGKDDDVNGLIDKFLSISLDYANGRIVEETRDRDEWIRFQTEYADMLSYGTMRHFVDDLMTMKSRIHFQYPEITSRDYDFFVFENGQGLKIGQQQAENFFHCTPSDTGAFSVIRAMQDLNLVGDSSTDTAEVEMVVPVYVSRTYLTRHGAGPFSASETSEPPFGEKPDETNVPNDFQGAIRYAKLSGNWDFNDVQDDIVRFRSTCEPQCNVKPLIAVTHVGDESREGMAYFPRLPNVMFSTDQPVGTSCNCSEVL